MKKFLFPVIALFFIVSIQAQKVEIKKGIIYVEEKPCLKIVNSGLSSWEISTFDGEDSIMAMYFLENDSYCKPLQYTKIILAGQGDNEAKSYVVRGGYGKKQIVSLLLKAGMLDKDNCRFDWNKLPKFEIFVSDGR